MAVLSLHSAVETWCIVNVYKGALACFSGSTSASSINQPNVDPREAHTKFENNLPNVQAEYSLFFRHRRFNHRKDTIMPIMKNAIKYGALFGVAREAGKALDKHEQNKTNNQSSAPPGESQNNREQPSQGHHQQPQQPPPPPQQPQQFRDANGYLHQTWCNGQCQSQCNGPAGNDGK